MKIGLIGWRGMVGSALLERMRLKGDLDHIHITYFSNSQAGQQGPDGRPLADARDIDQLAEFSVLVTCQGSAYTCETHPALRARGWDGYWIDASSALRMDEQAILILDPVNRGLIDRALDAGIKDLIGGNCTVSLMLMAIAGLLRDDRVEWISAMTYQAASGAGANGIQELAGQTTQIGAALDGSQSITQIDRTLQAAQRSAPTPIFGAPIVANLIPWIDSAVEDGQTREEWKGQVETNKILGTTKTIFVDGVCVRVPVARCHSQGLTIKLREAIPIPEIEAMLAGAHEWVDVVPNTAEATRERLTPAAVNGTLTVAIGRLRTLKMGPEYLSAFTVGDQLLWGAAEPLRRMIRILAER